MPRVSLDRIDVAGGALNASQRWIKVDGRDVVRLNDAVDPHDNHGAAAMAQASALWRIDGLGVVREGDAASCGHNATGSAFVTSD